MKSAENKNNYSETVSQAEQLVDHWSFAGYGKSGSYDYEHRSLAGEPLLWRTRTVRGPGNVLLSDRLEGGADVAPQHGTAVIVQSPHKTTAILFQGQRKALTATEYTVEYMEGGVAMVGEGVQNELPKVWAATIGLEPDSVAKIIDMNGLASAASVDQADVRQELDTVQQHEFGAVYNALAAIRADGAAQHHAE